MTPTTRTSKSAKRCLRMKRGLTGAILTGLLIAPVNLVGTAIAHAETALIAVAANFADRPSDWPRTLAPKLAIL